MSMDIVLLWNEDEITATNIFQGILEVHTATETHKDESSVIKETRIPIWRS